MAPSTRLRIQPARRVDYSEGSRARPITVDDTPPGPAVVPTNPPARTRRSARKPAPRVKDGAVVKSKAPAKKAVKVAQPKKLPPAKRECSICVTEKSITHSFRLDKDEDACEHFKEICSQCVTNMVTSKIESRQLSEPGLACPYTDCQHVLDHARLKMAFASKENFKEYDASLVKYLMAADPSFITCLSPTCGEYFSIQDCALSTESKFSSQEIACPHCDYKLCLTCNRPWHADTGCSKAAELEEAKCVEQIKKLGAKPCPKCGLNIEKHGGCDHMTCHQCRHNFCWQCLASMDANNPHNEGCPLVRRNVAVDPGNWAPDNMTEAQIDNLIAQARRRMDEPQRIPDHEFDAMVDQAPPRPPLPLGPLPPLLADGQGLPPVLGFWGTAQIMHNIFGGGGQNGGDGGD